MTNFSQFIGSIYPMQLPSLE